jgi:Flp pilus assembly protein TadB
MFSLNPKNFMIIFEEPMGQIAVAVGIVMEIIGYFVIMKIVDVDV